VSQRAYRSFPTAGFFLRWVLTDCENHFKQAVELRWPERHVIPPARNSAARQRPMGSWNAIGSSLAAALATGRLTLFTETIVSRLVAPTAARFVDGCVGIRISDRHESKLKGRAVVLCGSHRKPSG